MFYSVDNIQISNIKNDRRFKEKLLKTREKGKGMITLHFKEDDL